MAKRSYGGVSAEQRRAGRRAAFLQAGAEIIASGGFAKLTVRAVCGQAGYTERYFYESFDSTDALISELFDGMVSELTAAALANVAAAPADTRSRMRAGIAATINAMVDEPYRLRLFTEAEFSPALTQRRRQFISNAASSLLSVARDHYGTDSIENTGLRGQFATVHFIGGLYEVLIGWSKGDIVADRDEIIEMATDMLAAIGNYLNLQVRNS